MTKVISANDFVARLRDGTCGCVVDVRTLGEREALCLKTPSLSQPLDVLDPELVRNALPDPNAPFFIMCKSGRRSQNAAAVLEAAGLTGATVVEGGMDACALYGAEIVHNLPLSLDRQINVGIGVAVLITLFLGATVSPFCYWGTAVLGGGLVFLGITGSGWLHALMARASWNR